MPRPPSDPELKTEFSARIKERLAKTTAQDIATILGVKRQMVYNYRDGKNVPSPEVIRRAMDAWPGFTISYRGKVLTLQDFPQRPTLVRRKAVQYELWDVIKKLDSKSVQIEILEREASSVQLGIRIYFQKK